MANDPSQTDDFVNKLATDDDFRKKVETDPKGAFAEHGMEPHPDDLTAGKTLPSKEEISQNLEAIKNRAQGGGALGIPVFHNQASEGGIWYSEQVTEGGIVYSDKAQGDDS